MTSNEKNEMHAKRARLSDQELNKLKVKIIKMPTYTVFSNPKKTKKFTKADVCDAIDEWAKELKPLE